MEDRSPSRSRSRSRELTSTLRELGPRAVARRRRLLAIVNAVLPTTTYVSLESMTLSTLKKRLDDMFHIAFLVTCDGDEIDDAVYDFIIALERRIAIVEKESKQ